MDEMQVVFNDGSTALFKGDRYEIRDGCLFVGVKAHSGAYGQVFADKQWQAFPLTAVVSFKWKR